MSDTDNLSVANQLSRHRKVAPKDPEFGRRFFLAWKDLEKREGKSVALAAIGARVAKLERRYDVGGELDPYSHATVHGWRSGTRPEARTIRAIARVLGIDAGELLDTSKPSAAYSDSGMVSLARHHAEKTLGPDIPAATSPDKSSGTDGKLGG